MAVVPGVSLSSEEEAVSDPLVGVPEEVRTLLWQGFLKALEPVIWFWERTPAGTKHALPPRVLEHCGERFNEAMVARQQWKTLCNVWRIEFWQAADVLEAWLLDERDSATYLRLLTACCTRIGQIYRAVEQRGGLLFARTMLEWELKLLCYRGSLVVAPLLFEEAGR
jgi:hypothetical protein